MVQATAGATTGVDVAAIQALDDDDCGSAEMAIPTRMAVIRANQIVVRCMSLSFIHAGWERMV